MTRTTQGKTPDTEGDEVVLMYPGNELKPEVRPFAKTISVFKVVSETFFENEVARAAGK
jgi:hypothetical protein